MQSKPDLGRRALLLVPYGWLAVFFLMPFLLVLAISLSSVRLGMPPYEPLFAWQGSLLSIRLNLENFIFVLGENTYLLAYLTSLKVAAISTALMLAIAYPLAYGIASCAPAE